MTNEQDIKNGGGVMSDPDTGEAVGQGEQASALSDAEIISQLPIDKKDFGGHSFNVLRRMRATAMKKKGMDKAKELDGHMQKYMEAVTNAGPGFNVRVPTFETARRVKELEVLKNEGKLSGDDVMDFIVRAKKLAEDSKAFTEEEKALNPDHPANGVREYIVLNALYGQVETVTGFSPDIDVSEQKAEETLGKNSLSEDDSTAVKTIRRELTRALGVELTLDTVLHGVLNTVRNIREHRQEVTRAQQEEEVKRQQQHVMTSQQKKRHMAESDDNQPEAVAPPKDLRKETLETLSKAMQELGVRSRGQGNAIYAEIKRAIERDPTKSLFTLIQDKLEQVHGMTNRDVREDLGTGLRKARNVILDEAADSGLTDMLEDRIAQNHAARDSWDDTRAYFNNPNFRNPIVRELRVRDKWQPDFEGIMNSRIQLEFARMDLVEEKHALRNKIPNSDVSVVNSIESKLRFYGFAKGTEVISQEVSEDYNRDIKRQQADLQEGLMRDELDEPYERMRRGLEPVDSTADTQQTRVYGPDDTQPTRVRRPDTPVAAFDRLQSSLDNLTQELSRMSASDRRREALEQQQLDLQKRQIELMARGYSVVSHAINSRARLDPQKFDSDQYQWFHELDENKQESVRVSLALSWIAYNKAVGGMNSYKPWSDMFALGLSKEGHNALLRSQPLFSKAHATMVNHLFEVRTNRDKQKGHHFVISKRGYNIIGNDETFTKYKDELSLRLAKQLYAGEHGVSYEDVRDENLEEVANSGFRTSYLALGKTAVMTAANYFSALGVFDSADEKFKIRTGDKYLYSHSVRVLMHPDKYAKAKIPKNEAALGPIGGWLRERYDRTWSFRRKFNSNKKRYAANRLVYSAIDHTEVGGGGNKKTLAQFFLDSQYSQEVGNGIYDYKPQLNTALNDIKTSDILGYYSDLFSKVAAVYEHTYSNDRASRKTPKDFMDRIRKLREYVLIDEIKASDGKHKQYQDRDFLAAGLCMGFSALSLVGNDTEEGPMSGSDRLYPNIAIKRERENKYMDQGKRVSYDMILTENLERAAGADLRLKWDMEKVFHSINTGWLHPYNSFAHNSWILPSRNMIRRIDMALVGLNNTIDQGMKLTRYLSDKITSPLRWGIEKAKMVYEELSNRRPA